MKTLKRRGKGSGAEEIYVILGGGKNSPAELLEKEAKDPREGTLRKTSFPLECKKKKKKTKHKG